nr:uncharacterized protein CI109_001223 [Kwoniella shandongensis]KAA5530420.1 hypothetical protein CI109_001223 [Kwoniella shandongensis]
MRSDRLENVTVPGAGTGELDQVEGFFRREILEGLAGDAVEVRRLEIILNLAARDDLKATLKQPSFNIFTLPYTMTPMYTMFNGFLYLLGQYPPEDVERFALNQLRNMEEDARPNDESNERTAPEVTIIGTVNDGEKLNLAHAWLVRIFRHAVAHGRLDLYTRIPPTIAAAQTLVRAIATDRMQLHPLTQKEKDEMRRSIERAINALTDILDRL